MDDHSSFRLVSASMKLESNVYGESKTWFEKSLEEMKIALPDVSYEVLLTPASAHITSLLYHSFLLQAPPAAQHSPNWSGH